MSGPKRGYWRTTYYDPRPDRLDDLSGFASVQTAWLSRNGGFIRHNLGEDGLARAQAALDLVQQCIANEDPDAGFDAYGQAWDVLHGLQRQAVEAKDRRQHQERLRRQEEEARRRQEQQRRREETARRQEEQQRRREAEGRRRQEQQRRREEMARRQEEQQRRREERERQTRAAAERAVKACRDEWEDSEHRALLDRWTSPLDRSRLDSDLRSMAAGTPEQVPQVASAWQDRFERVLAAAAHKASENSRAVGASIPALRAATGLATGLNTKVLPSGDRHRFDENKARLRQRAEAALSAEDLATLRAATEGLKALAAEYQPKVKAAELKESADRWRSALAQCGYSVAVRTGPDGGIILEASSFPMKSLNVEVRPDSPEVKLEVSGKHDHARCIKDVQGLQAALAQRGVELTMTDWGAAKPGSTQAMSVEKVSLGGGR